MSCVNKELEAEVKALRAELTSVQTALSLVLSAEHRELVNSKDVRKVFMDMVREMRREEERDQYARQVQLQESQITWATGTSSLSLGASNFPTGALKNVR